MCTLHQAGGVKIMGLEHNVADVLEDLEEHLIGNGIVIDPLLRSPNVAACNSNQWCSD
jgi:hypothetical protein